MVTRLWCHRLRMRKPEACLAPWDTQDVRERKKLPGSVAKLIKGYELRAWWFEIFECGRKARPLAASNTCLG